LTYPTTTAAYEAVHVGTCQAFVLDVALVSLEKKTRPTAYGPVAGQIITHESYGAVLQKNSKLTPIMNGVLKKLTKNRTIARLQKKWFNVNFAKIPVLK
jgi:ABC-type amino acid transport substrate-binding protein